MAIKKARLKIKGVLGGLSPDDADHQLWERISGYMDGEVASVTETKFQGGKYVFLGLEDLEKDKELSYMLEQDSRVGRYVGSRETFDEDWDSGEYEPDGCLYLDAADVELLESGG